MITLFQIIHYFICFLYSFISESEPLPGLTLGVLLIPIEGKSEPCWISIYIPFFFNQHGCGKPQHFPRKTIVFPDLCWMFFQVHEPLESPPIPRRCLETSSKPGPWPNWPSTTPRRPRETITAWCFGT